MSAFLKKSEQYQHVSALVVEPDQTIKATVIWLHGLGADGHDFEPVVPYFAPEKLGLRFIFPHAPARPITLNGGYQMPAWYDIYALKFGAQEDAPGIHQAAGWIEEIINRENQRGISYGRIILGGFSQGGALSLHCGLRFPQRLGGILALSTYLPLASTLAQELNPNNQNIPIMMAHGTYDSLVPIDWAEYAKNQLNALGISVAWHAYPIEHTVCMEELTDIANWMQGIL